MQWATTQLNLGNAYGKLPKGNQQANLEKAIAYFEAALKVFTHETYPTNWAMVQHSLGVAYCNLQSGDQQANLEKAIACFKAAM